MLTTIELLDLLQIEAQKRGKNPSDYAVAQLLNLNKSTVGHWRTGRQGMGDEIAVKASRILGLPPMYVIACLLAERHRDKPLERIYTEMAKALSPSKLENSRVA